MVVALSVVILAAVTGSYFAWSIVSTGTTDARKTLHSVPTASGSGEGIVSADPTNSEMMEYLALGLRDSVPSFSLNGGSTWNETVPFTITTPASLLDPWITYDSEGRVYASTYEGNATHPYDRAYPFLAKSTNHGLSFSLLSTSYSPPWTMWIMANGNLAPSCYMPGAGAIDFPKVAADKSPTSPYKDYVYIVGAVAVNNSATSSCFGQTGVIRSTDGGATWDIHRVLAGLNSQIVVRPDNLVVAPNGIVYFATGSYEGKGGVLLVYSKDGGATWSTSAVSLGFIAGDPWMAVDRSNSMNLYVTFEKSFSDGSIHIYMIDSTNGGATWSTPIRLDDILSNDAVDHILPSIDVSPSGRVFVAWRDYRNTSSKTWSNSNTTDIYAYSSAHPAANIRISDSTGRYCGPFTPCYHVAGNDYFGVMSSDSADNVAFSLAENGNSSPGAYDGIVQYSTTTALSPLTTAMYRIVTSLYLEFVGLFGISLTIAVIIISLRRRATTRTEEPNSSSSLANWEGLMSQLLNKNLRGMESSCIVKGDGLCAFDLSQNG